MKKWKWIGADSSELIFQEKDIAYTESEPIDYLEELINDNIDIHDYSGKCIGTMDKETIKQAYEMVLQTH